MTSSSEPVELGCATAYDSARLAHRGARPVGVDVTARLETEFHLPLGELFALLRECGFDVLDVRELYAPENARKAECYPRKR